MASFKDNTGREWSLDLTVGTVKRVEKLTGVNLGVIEQKTFESLASDWSKLVDVICAVIRPQLEETGVSDEDFACSLGGDELSEATDALLLSLVDFFPPKKREVLHAAIAKMNAMQDRLIARATARLSELKLPDDVDSGEPSTSTPERSASTPSDGPCENSQPLPTAGIAESGTAAPGSSLTLSA